MNSHQYITEVLKTDLLPYIQTVPSAVFQQDSAWQQQNSYILSELTTYHFFPGLRAHLVFHLLPKSRMLSHMTGSPGHSGRYYRWILGMHRGSMAGHSSERYLESPPFHAMPGSSCYLRSCGRYWLLRLPCHLQVCIVDHLRLYAIYHKVSTIDHVFLGVTVFTNSNV